MCERCRDEKIEFVEYEPDPDEFCEWRDEDLDSEEDEFGGLLQSCPEPPCFVARNTFVDEHLCDYHVKNNPDLDPDALGFAESVGLGSAELLPIRDRSEDCEYGQFLGNGVACSNKAEWAVMVTVEYLLCESHAAEERHKDKS